MKKFCVQLGLLLALMLPAFAQQDIQITNTSIYKTLALNKSWPDSGISGLVNFYIFKPVYSNSGLCFFIQNNDASLHTFQLNMWTTGNIQTTTLAGNIGAWQQTNVRNQADGSLVFTVAASSSLSLSLPSVAANPRVAVQITNTSGVGTATASVTETPGGVGCTNSLLVGLRANGSYSSIPICDRSATGTVAGGVTTKIVTTSPALASYICSITLSINTVVTVQGAYILRQGSGATCGTSSLDIYSVNLGTAIGSGIFSNAGSGIIGPPTANDICLINGAGDGTVRYSISFLQMTQLP